MRIYRLYKYETARKYMLFWPMTITKKLFSTALTPVANLPQETILACVFLLCKKDPVNLNS